MPYSSREANSYALAAQAIIFFNLMSSLAQPLGAGMDVALSGLLLGFTALTVVLSMPALKKKGPRAKTPVAAELTVSAPLPIKGETEDVKETDLNA